MTQSNPTNDFPQPSRRAMKLRAWSNHAWHWVATPRGFFSTVYSLNIVAWGGMLFLLMCNAAPAMCHPTCNDLYSPRRIWIEITSQILNGLFCVTGFGLAPWRFRDLYWWFHWRLGNHHKSLAGIARLVSIHQAWYRLPIATPCVCHVDGVDFQGTKSASAKAPILSLSGARIPATRSWKLDFVVWCNMWNTIFQGCLAGCMWGMNRFNRPSWTTGLFVALACCMAGMAGWMVFHETRKVVRDEAKAVSTETRSELSVGGSGNVNCV